MEESRECPETVSTVKEGLVLRVLAALGMSSVTLLQSLMLEVFVVVIVVVFFFLVGIITMVRGVTGAQDVWWLRLGVGNEPALAIL